MWLCGDMAVLHIAVTSLHAAFMQPCLAVWQHMQERSSTLMHHLPMCLSDTKDCYNQQSVEDDCVQHRHVWGRRSMADYRGPYLQPYIHFRGLPEAGTGTSVCRLPLS